jgi:O-antigen/teichoic acid export membrane protein
LAIALGANLLYLVAVTFTTMTYAQSTITTTIIGVLFKNGFWTQLTNFIQTMNYRISVIILARYWGKNAVGYFGACLQLAEAIWIIGKSLAMVQYAKLVSTTDENYQVKFTMLFSRICLLFTVLASVVLLLIPESWMLKVLGNDLKGIILYLYVLIPGIICFSIVPVLSSFYSARGKFHVNTIASAVSLLFISVSAYVLIPDYSVWGAAVVYSSGLAFLMIFYVVLLTARYKVGLVDFIPYKNDLQQIKTIINDYRKKKP